VDKPGNKRRGNTEETIMGGLAIKPLIGREADRIPVGRYMNLFREISQKIREADQYSSVTSPLPYWGKESHGDLDIIVNTMIEDICCIFPGMQFTKNDKCTSLAYPDGDSIYQVDIIRYDNTDLGRTKATNLLWYMNNGNFGNLVGKVLHSYSFILSGEEGLVYQVRKGHIRPDITTQDYEIVKDTIVTGVSMYGVLDLLGLSRSLYTSGFKSNLEASQHIATSCYYNNSAFQEGAFRHGDRVRERKRQAYEHIKSIPGVSTKTRIDLINEVSNLNTGGVRLKDEITSRVSKSIVEDALSEKYGSMFCGSRIADLTGLKGTDLGRLCAAVRKRHPKSPETAYMMSQKDVDALILAEFRSLV
jgi:hypothetical protein